MGILIIFKQKIKENRHRIKLYKEKQMKRRIDSLIKEITALHDDYFRLINTSKQHYENLLYITINVSEFFRNRAQWLVMEKNNSFVII